MIDIDKIVEEAARKIQGWIQSDDDEWLDGDIEKATSIIKSACEKATVELSFRCEQWIARCRELESQPTAIVTNTQQPGTHLPTNEKELTKLAREKAQQLLHDRPYIGAGIDEDELTDAFLSALEKAVVKTL